MHLTQQLSPRRPPGIATRKAAAWSSEIARLRAEGYTLEAIREALEDAGCVVGKSTVQREAARAASKASAAMPAAPAVGVAEAPARELIGAPAPAATAQVGSQPRSGEGLPAADSGTEAPAGVDWSQMRGKDIAEQFVSTHRTNPLLRPTKPRRNKPP